MLIKSFEGMFAELPTPLHIGVYFACKGYTS
jgi:hypothetical protein